MTAEELLRRLSTGEVAGFVLVLARVAPLFVLAPMFSSRLVPARTRSIVAVALAVGLSPLALRGAHVPTDSLRLGGLIGKELLVGLAFAFAISVLFSALSAAGALLDTSIGFAYGALIDPVTGNQGTVLAQLYGLVAVMVFISIGGDAFVVQGLARTYDLVPLLSWPDLRDLVAGTLHAFAGVVTAAVEVAGPVLLALILTDAAFGVVSRVVPQLNVFAVGFPAKVLVGLAVLAASLPFVVNWLADGLAGSVAQSLSALHVR